MQKIRRLKILFAVVVPAAIYWFGLRPDPRVETLNQALHEISSPSLRSYPYSFRVVRLDGESAVMTTPRSPGVPVYRMIGAIHPNLAGKAPNDPDFIAAEKALAQMQSEAHQIVMDQTGVSDVKWVPDKNWLMAHEILMDSSNNN